MAGSIVLWHGDLPAQLHWDETPEGWYINFGAIGHTALAARLMLSFRDAWRKAGKPTIYFHHSPDNQAMGRLCKLFSAVSVGRNLHKLVSLTTKEDL